MKRFSIVPIVLVLALTAAACTPRAVTEDGNEIVVDKLVFEEIVLNVQPGQLRADIGENQLDVNQITSQFGMGNLSDFTDSLSEWMDFAGVSTISISFSGDGLMLEVNDQPFPSLAFPEGSLESTINFGLDVAPNAGMTFDPQLETLIRDSIAPVATDALEAIRLTITLSFQ